VWGSEPSPSAAALGRLSGEEVQLYDALRHDVHGSSVRLERELTSWHWALDRFFG
jgi:hypothetical protein